MRAHICAAFGNQCGICGYSRCTRALELHHLDPNEKDFTVSPSTTLYRWSRVVEEVRKCVLLCANCHREVHAGITSIPDSIQRFDEAFTQIETNQRVRKKKACLRCQRLIYADQQWCSNKCRGLDYQRVDWSNPEIFQRVKDTGSYLAVAKTLGVSSHTVAKHMTRLYPEYDHPNKKPRKAKGS